MPLLVRKISKSKWMQTDLQSGDDVSADAITLCLKTAGNRLSVWQIESAAEIDEALLGIVSTQAHLETIDLVALSPDHIRENSIVVSEADNPTPVGDLRSGHRNLCELSYRKLGVVAYHIAGEITQRRDHRYTENQQKRVLLKAITDGMLEPGRLSPDVQKKLNS